MWVNDVFYYSVGMLKGIAEHYESLYTDGSLPVLYMIAESKADFDRSLDSIGRGNWKGLTSNKFGAYKYFGRQQQVVIAYILNISDRKLEGMGFYNIPQLRHEAYKRMVAILNGG